MLLKISGVCLVVLGMVCLLPSSPSVQGTIRISSVYGPVEHKTPIATGFVPLSSSSLLVNVGDRVRTGPEGTLTLELPDGTFMIVHQNSAITIQEPPAPTLRNLFNVAMRQSAVPHPAIWRKVQTERRWNSDGPYRGSGLKANECRGQTHKSPRLEPSTTESN